MTMTSEPSLTRKQFYRILEEMRRTSTSDSALFISIVNRAESKKVDRKRVRFYELAKLLVLTSLDEDFVKFFRDSSGVADDINNIKKGFRLGLLTKDLTLQVPDSVKRIALQCRLIRTMIEKEIYGAGYFFFERELRLDVQSVH